MRALSRIPNHCRLELGRLLQVHGSMLDNFHQMLEDAEMCREHARRCLQRAKLAPSLSTALRFESAAHSWLRLAKDLDGVDALLHQQGIDEHKAF